MRAALIAGSSGLTGSELLKLLLDSPLYSKVYSLVRKKSGIIHEKLVELHTDYVDLEKPLSVISAVDDVFCCLGTTIKKARSKEEFRRVDHDLPLQLAHWSEKKGVKHFLCISAMGADAKSFIFYNKVKGEMERDIAALKIPAVTFFRPSLLVGNRRESRPGEKAAIVIFNFINFLLIGPLLNYRSIKVTKVAKAIFDTALRGGMGVKVVMSGEMQ